MNLNQRYPEQGQIATSKQPTYMEQMVEQLDIQLKIYSDFRDRLFRVGVSLQAEQPREADIRKEPAPEMASGYLSTLNNKIDQFRRINSDMEQTINKLEQMF